MRQYMLEVCADSVESAIAAQKGGADRIELCSNLVIGGVTPGRALFGLVRKYTDIKIHVLLRPRYGDYCYNTYEFEQLKEEVQMYREMKAEGIVIGMLNADGSLDTYRMKELVKTAGNMKIVLHRAFDVCVNPMAAMEQAIAIGMDTILTSGQQDSAWRGKELLKELYKQSRGRIEILAAGGIDAGVMERLIPYTGISAYHMSGKIEKDSVMTFRKPETKEEDFQRDEYTLWQASEEKISQAVQSLAARRSN